MKRVVLIHMVSLSSIRDSFCLTDEHLTEVLTPPNRSDCLLLCRSTEGDTKWTDFQPSPMIANDARFISLANSSPVSLLEFLGHGH